EDIAGDTGKDIREIAQMNALRLRNGGGALDEVPIALAIALGALTILRELSLCRAERVLEKHYWLDCNDEPITVGICQACHLLEIRSVYIDSVSKASVFFRECGSSVAGSQFQKLQQEGALRDVSQHILISAHVRVECGCHCSRVLRRPWRLALLDSQKVVVSVEKDDEIGLKLDHLHKGHYELLAAYVGTPAGVDDLNVTTVLLEALADVSDGRRSAMFHCTPTQKKHPER